MSLCPEPDCNAEGEHVGVMRPWNGGPLQVVHQCLKCDGLVWWEDAIDQPAMMARLMRVAHDPLLCKDATHEDCFEAQLLTLREATAPCETPCADCGGIGCHGNGFCGACNALCPHHAQPSPERA